MDSMMISPDMRLPSSLITPDSPHAAGTLLVSTFQVLYWSPNANLLILPLEGVLQELRQLKRARHLDRAQPQLVPGAGASLPQHAGLLEHLHPLPGLGRAEPPLQRLVLGLLEDLHHAEAVGAELGAGAALQALPYVVAGDDRIGLARDYRPDNVVRDEGVIHLGDRAVVRARLAAHARHHRLVVELDRHQLAHPPDPVSYTHLTLP